MLNDLLAKRDDLEKLLKGNSIPLNNEQISQIKTKIQEIEKQLSQQLLKIKERPWELTKIYTGQSNEETIEKAKQILEDSKSKAWLIDKKNLENYIRNFTYSLVKLRTKFNLKNKKPFAEEIFSYHQLKPVERDIIIYLIESAFEEAVKSLLEVLMKQDSTTTLLAVN